MSPFTRPSTTFRATRSISETVAEQWPHFKRCMGAVLGALATPAGTCVWGEHASHPGGNLCGRSGRRRRRGPPSATPKRRGTTLFARPQREQPMPAPNLPQRGRKPCLQPQAVLENPINGQPVARRPGLYRLPGGMAGLPEGGRQQLPLPPRSLRRYAPETCRGGRWRRRFASSTSPVATRVRRWGALGRNWKVEHYHGIDLSEPALALAETRAARPSLLRFELYPGGLCRRTARADRPLRRRRLDRPVAASLPRPARSSG